VQPDPPQTRVLKEHIVELSPFVVELFNRSLQNRANYIQSAIHLAIAKED